MSRFEDLSDVDFELFVADLLSAHWRVRVETFPRGRDGGVDLRVLGPTGPPLSLPARAELVVQCKHHPRGTVSSLGSALAKEIVKPAVRDASRYVLATSARLTRLNKQQVTALLAGRVAERDILAFSDLEDLLRRHPEVEARNLKLWLHRAGTLRATLHQVEHLRTAAFLDDLGRLQQTFVETQVVRSAIQVAERNGLCVLTGPPGAGKTTAASLVVLRYMTLGWQPVVAISDVEELERQWRPGVKQVLYYDDFLGQNSLAAKLHKNEDAALVSLMRKVEQDDTKVLILTTRNYILRQAQQSYEKLNDPVFKLAETAVSVQSLDAGQREHVLRNQLYFSPLREAAAAAISASGGVRLERMVNSPHYSPRLTDDAIAMMVRDRFPRQHRRGWPGTLGDHTSAPPEIDVLGELERALRNPGQLWEHVISHQLRPPQVEVLITLASFGDAPVSVTRLSGAARALSGRSDYDIRAALQVLDGDLISILHDVHVPPERTEVDLRGPGVADALVAHLLRDQTLPAQLADSASSFAQVRWLAALAGLDETGPWDPAEHDVVQLARVRSAAERVFTSASLCRTLFGADEEVWVKELDGRMSLLGRLYAATKHHGDVAFIGHVAQLIVDGLETIELHRLLAAIDVMDEPWMENWRPHRIILADLLLRYLNNPHGVADWRNLMDALDVIAATTEFRDDAFRRFEDFAAEMISAGQERFEDDPEDLAEDDFADDLRELRDLAARWEMAYPELDELIDLLDELSEDLATEQRYTVAQRSDGAAGQEALFTYP